MDIPVALAYLCGAVAALCYGVSSLLLATGAGRLLSAFYLGGLGFQAAGFLLAFIARSQAPLLVVQSAVTASVGVTAALGMLIGRWRLTRIDVAALAAVILGVVLVGVAAQPGLVTGMPRNAIVACSAVLVICLIPLLVPSRATPGLLGALAGSAYGASAVAARAVAGNPDFAHLLRTPVQTTVLAVLIVGGVLVGQVLLTVAFRRTHTATSLDPSTTTAAATVTGPVAALYVASTVLPALAGLLWLGDQLRPGLAPMALVGLVVAMAGAVVLSRWEST